MPTLAQLARDWSHGQDLLAGMALPCVMHLNSKIPHKIKRKSIKNLLQPKKKTKRASIQQQAVSDSSHMLNHGFMIFFFKLQKKAMALSLTVPPSIYEKRERERRNERNSTSTNTNIQTSIIFFVLTLRENNSIPWGDMTGKPAAACTNNQTQKKENKTNLSRETAGKK